jgi:hypothetical protein
MVEGVEWAQKAVIVSYVSISFVRLIMKIRASSSCTAGGGGLEVI